MKGRTWKNVDDIAQKEVQKYLLENGGVEEEAKGFIRETYPLLYQDNSKVYRVRCVSCHVKERRRGGAR